MTADPATGMDPGPAADPAPNAAAPAAEPTAATRAATATRAGPPATALVVALVPLAVAVNFLANSLVALLGLPIYLDTIGTFLAAAILGPWWGALAGVMTNVVGVLPNGASNLLFAPVNVAAALVWGYGIRRLLLGRTVAGRAVLPETPGTRRLAVALAGIVAGIVLAAIAVLALPPA